MKNKVNIFYCYAHEDEDIRKALDTHLSTLRRIGLIKSWHDGDILSGTEWEETIATQLNAADIILLLVSSDFIGSDYCYEKEMMKALERHAIHRARVIPILLRPVDWEGTPFSKLQMLPTGTKAITLWSNRDEALNDVARGIREAIDDFLAQKNQVVQTPAFPSSLFGNKRFQLSLRRVVLLGSLLLLLIGSVNLYSIIHNNAVRLQAVATTTVVATLHLHAVATAASAKSAYEKGVNRQGLMIGFDASHSNYNPYEHVLSPTNVSQLQLAWAKKISEQPLQGGPLVVNNSIYVASFDGELRALDVSTGEIVAFYSTRDSINSSPTFANGTIYIGSWDGTFNALNAQTLNKIWSYPTTPQVRVESSSTFANGTIYVGANNGKLYAFDTVTSKMRWFFQTQSQSSIRAAPAVVGDFIYFSSLDGNFYALNATSGKEVWSYSTETLEESEPTIADNVFYAGGTDGTLYARDAKTGKGLWSYPVGQGVRSPAIANGIVYAGALNGNLYAFDAKTGALRWSYFTKGRIITPATIANGVVYIGSEDGKVYALNAKTGNLLWSYLTGGQIDSPIAVANGSIYVASYDGKVYAFRLKN